MINHTRHRTWAISLAGFAATLAGAAGSAWAGPIGSLELKFAGTGAGQNVRIDTGAGAMNVFAGEILFQTRGGSGAGEMFSALTLPTFCIEPTQFVQSGWQPYDVSFADQAATPNMDDYRAMALNTAASYFYSQKAAGLVDNSAAAGFQVALWEIMRDYEPSAGRASLDIGSGSFTARQTSGAALGGSVSAWTSQIFDVISNGSFDGNFSYVLSSSVSQDQIVPGPAGLALGRRRRA